ncbi:multi-sensor signal transduction histidine kinase [Gloeocapsa sp. PCC 7428]|uniref:sensor histidine kinase n=1 Tax=Gloeocapsa sp. PCC 7428 TaxID=1173026 RepID=UPI0002A5CCF7|nr:CHASE3 domain-containing protein [Gloeocapsa sp. PCC 7428]AFZ29366.1 multi-sensor signal transduction histidine kinase [Gloeocapsa sp. PCC 7428]
MPRLPGFILLRTRLLAPLYTSVLVLAILVCARAGIGFWLEFRRQDTLSWVRHTLQVQSQAELLLNAALDQETGIRGYLLTGAESSLEPYKSGQIDFNNTLALLDDLVADNPEQQHRVNEIITLYNRWQREFAQPVVLGAAPESNTTLAGKLLFDPLRSQVMAMLQREEDLLARRNQQLYRLDQSFRVFNILAPVLLLLGIGINLWLLHRRVEVPLHQLASVAQTWETGRMQPRLNFQAADEIGQLARILDRMASEIDSRQTRSDERNRQLDDLIASLSHDLRTPLLAIRGTLRSMLHGAFGSVSDTWREILEEYYQTNEDLLKLVEALLEVSRYEAGSKNLIYEPLDWNKIFTKTINQERIASKSKLHFELQLTQPLPIVYGDELEIGRVIQNLLSNAVRVSKLNSQVQLAVVAENSGVVRVSVSDRGPGIAPQEQEYLFHRFIQGRGRRGGAGLGLYLCRQIVEAHQGTIGVDSIVGQGSTFWFTLPIVPQVIREESCLIANRQSESY